MRTTRCCVVQVFQEERGALATEQGADNLSSDESQMDGRDAHALASLIWQMGCDPDEFER